MTTEIDVEAVESLAEALANVDGFGDEFRTEPPHPAEHAPRRATCRDEANRILERVAASGFLLVRGAA